MSLDEPSERSNTCETPSAAVLAPLRTVCRGFSPVGDGKEETVQQGDFVHTLPSAHTGILAYVPFAAGWAKSTQYSRRPDRASRRRAYPVGTPLPGICDDHCGLPAHPSQRDVHRRHPSWQRTASRFLTRTCISSSPSTCGSGTSTQPTKIALPQA